LRGASCARASDLVVMSVWKGGYAVESASVFT
jgi:hypothetical protein